MIVEVDEKNLRTAAEIHSVSWKSAHRAFCSDDVLEKHSVENQISYLADGMKNGVRHFMLVDKKPVGIVSVNVNLIENLYILPDEQHKGYGTQLLRFAMEKCNGNPRLFVLENNSKAQAMYRKNGFRPTGKRQPFSDNLSELEMEIQTEKIGLKKSCRHS